ncbi:MAG TPA: hypothetical protein V6C58_25550 [Allocoleopsis sp.]
MDWSNVLVGLGAGATRVLTGWFKSAVADGKISAMEWKELGIQLTVMTVAFIAVSNGTSIDNSLLEVGISFVVNEIITGLRKRH